MTIRIPLIVLAAIASAAFSSVGGTRMSQDQTIDVRRYRGPEPLRWTEYSDIATLIENLPPWGDRDFTPDEWNRYLVLAHALQGLDGDSMERILLIYLDRAWLAHGEKAEWQAYTQPMILLRVMFETSTEPVDLMAARPAQVASLQRRGVTIMGTGLLWRPFDPEADRTIASISHPVAFDESGPHLLGGISAGGPGSGGSRPSYQLHLEYRTFAEVYGKRDLTPFIEEPKDWRRLVWEASEAGEL